MQKHMVSNGNCDHYIVDYLLLNIVLLWICTDQFDIPKNKFAIFKLELNKFKPVYKGH